MQNHEDKLRILYAKYNNELNSINKKRYLEEYENQCKLFLKNSNNNNNNNSSNTNTGLCSTDYGVYNTGNTSQYYIGSTSSAGLNWGCEGCRVL